MVKLQISGTRLIRCQPGSSTKAPATAFPALVAMITTTLIWGLFLVAVLAAAHAAALWKTWPSDPVQT